MQVAPLTNEKQLSRRLLRLTNVTKPAANSKLIVPTSVDNEALQAATIVAAYSLLARLTNINRIKDAHPSILCKLLVDNVLNLLAKGSFVVLVASNRLRWLDINVNVNRYIFADTLCGCIVYETEESKPQELDDPSLGERDCKQHDSTRISS